MPARHLRDGFALYSRCFARLVAIWRYRVTNQRGNTFIYYMNPANGEQIAVYIACDADCIAGDVSHGPWRMFSAGMNQRRVHGKEEPVVASLENMKSLLPPEDVCALLDSPFLPVFYQDVAGLAREVSDALAKLGRRGLPRGADRRALSHDDLVRLGARYYLLQQDKETFMYGQLVDKIRHRIADLMLILGSVRMATAMRTHLAFTIQGDAGTARTHLRPLLDPLVRTPVLVEVPVRARAMSRRRVLS